MIRRPSKTDTQLLSMHTRDFDDALQMLKSHVVTIIDDTTDHDTRMFWFQRYRVLDKIDDHYQRWFASQLENQDIVSDVFRPKS